MYDLVTIKRANPSTHPQKKMVAVFERNSNTGTHRRLKHVYFGSRGMSDYTHHKDPDRKQLYLQRHRARENWNNPYTAGSLSRWILWNKPTLKASIADYKRRFF